MNITTNQVEYAEQQVEVGSVETVGEAGRPVQRQNFQQIVCNEKSVKCTEREGLLHIMIICNTVERQTLFFVRLWGLRKIWA